MIKTKNVIKVMVLSVLLVLFSIVQSCGENDNHPKKTNEDIAKLSADDENIEPHHHADETEPHTHSHSSQSDTGKRIMNPEDIEELWIFTESKDFHYQ